MNDITIYNTKTFIACVPKVPHISREDGGHIWIRSKEKYFASRLDLSSKEAIEVMRLTMLVSEAMIKGIKNRGIEIERINYQEKGNWAYMEGKKPIFHIHLYGRTRNSKIQPFGQALNFPYKDTGFYDTFEPFNEEDIQEIQKQIQALEESKKYDITSWNLT